MTINDHPGAFTGPTEIRIGRVLSAGENSAPEAILRKVSHGTSSH